jgi:stearoyl-CoA desaturase (Delta-9 desaturase)
MGSDIKALDQDGSAPVRCLNWSNIFFFSVIHLTAVIGTPLYLISHSVPASIWWLTGLFYFGTGLSITVGYHRLFSHRCFKANKVINFLGLFFGAAAFEQSALKWSSQHRDHHRYVDTNRDPYNIKRGFFYAHMGWMLFHRLPVNMSNVEDLSKDQMFRHQDKHYGLWALGAGILLPVAMGGLLGSALAGFILTVCLRATMVYQGTFCINSVCHYFGKTTYDHASTAKDNWFTALFTWGEGFHNFHHRFPTDYRNGVCWYHWDPSKWLIRALSWVGLVSGLKRTSHFRMMSARIVADQRRISIHLAGAGKKQRADILLDRIKDKYQVLLHLLDEWELNLGKYRSLRLKAPSVPKMRISEALSQAHLTQARFRDAYDDWQTLVRNSVHAKKLLPQFGY